MENLGLNNNFIGFKGVMGRKRYFVYWLVTVLVILLGWTVISGIFFSYETHGISILSLIKDDAQQGNLSAELFKSLIPNLLTMLIPWGLAFLPFFALVFTISIGHKVRRIRDIDGTGRFVGIWIIVICLLDLAIPPLFLVIDSFLSLKKGLITNRSAVPLKDIFNNVACKLNSAYSENNNQLASYAGFWKRFLALIVDILLIMSLDFCFSTFIGTNRGVLVDVEESLVCVVAVWLYFSLMESSSIQATLGKMLLGIQVVDINGNRISFSTATGRYFGKFISLLTLYIGFIIAAFTTKRQALHDMMAKCLVVNKI